MKISEYFDLDKSQAELDFVDIDYTSDTPLFLDPFFLSKRTDNWSIQATLTLRSFFQRVIDLIRAGEENEAKELFDHLHEPNTTCLGMSRENPQGKGVGAGDADKIYESLLRSRAIQTGLIQDIEDNILFVDNFGKDKLSDMTTNIITKHLIEYTQNQCRLHDIPLSVGVNSGYFWNSRQIEWQSEHTEMLVIDNHKLLLVPKGIVSFCKAYVPNRYYRRFVLDFLQNENLRMNTALVQRRNNGVRYVTKKSIEEMHPQSKEFLRRFTRQHPEILQQFKNETEVNSLANIEFTEFDFRGVARALIARLQGIPTGTDNASNFHNVIIGILELIFYPHLINPVKEREIHDGRKRIDLVFDNSAQEGVFRRLWEQFNIPCPYIFVECKNYTKDVANPELDQLGGRFSVNRGRVGFIVCRSIDNMPLFIQRCKDTYIDGRGLIIPIVDNDLIQLLNEYNDMNWQPIEQFLSDRIREITI
ncbi:hypothetical protein [Flavobacterium sp. 2]|uniref:hypothetical protein n=1 Tax=Flavobacterium sp. 2 TaxID=308053 RepID=UPI000C17A629|nr:hypothetical protein [Flavobacterium sp. 2]PIF69455.1 hypothetical protein CLU99_0160 [Flavobacterium sp. 2]